MRKESAAPMATVRQRVNQTPILSFLLSLLFPASESKNNLFEQKTASK